jgi:hypothetical protein
VTRQDGHIVKLGDVDFGTGPIRVINCRLSVPPVKQAADVTIDNIVVRAEHFTGLPEPTHSLFTNGLVWAAVVLVLVLAAALWWWSLRRPGGEPSEPDAASPEVSRPRGRGR